VQKYYILYTGDQNYTSVSTYKPKEQEGYKAIAKYSKKQAKQDEGNQKEVIEKYFELNGYGLITLTKLLKIATDKNQIVQGIKSQVQEKCDSIYNKIQSLEDILEESGFKIGKDFTLNKDSFLKQTTQSFNSKTKGSAGKNRGDSDDSDSNIKRKHKKSDSEEDSDREIKRKKPTKGRPVDDSDSDDNKNKAKKPVKAKPNRKATISDSSSDDDRIEDSSKSKKKISSKKQKGDVSSEEENRKIKISKQREKVKSTSSDEDSEEKQRKSKPKSKNENIDKKSSGKFMKCAHCNKEENESNLLSIPGDIHSIHKKCLNQHAKKILPQFINFEDLKCPMCGKQIPYNLLEKQLDPKLREELDHKSLQGFI